ncbi:hypothetical protein [Candidatus Viridilinea mediisalina]|uniref:Uncharacterized protein n=1 Tax=Candidatus Viridilinea mediisalina TaxID=2024553 RepID=A0A2A6RJV6_9CHLR|nr:hypothetical protein [Candidatus Viridilinea mediisalina]PDW03150.1 hypothetical protein CJ255_10280 [Candidatus Viridilinea mediisalina]
MAQRSHRLLWGAQLLTMLLVGAYLIYFADHALQLLTFPFPLDYGEGPLVAQVARLLAGTSIWALYRDPSLAPFQIINYPPLYLIVTAALTPLTNSPLIAGRLVALLSTLASVVALALLAQRATPIPAQRSWRTVGLTLYPALFFLTIPIVREWAVLMRVDMLGLCLGLWGLVVLSWRGPPTAGRSILAALLLTASLFVKPSLIAAPAAALLWLLWLNLRFALPRCRAAALPPPRSPVLPLILFSATLALVGGGFFALFQWASGGWFALHVVAANANRWEFALAKGFWEQQLALRWPLAAAALLSSLLISKLARFQRSSERSAAPERLDASLILPMLYTLFGIVTAAGIGKVGAYSNYFLELYAGLIWLLTLGLYSAAISMPGYVHRRTEDLLLKPRIGYRDARDGPHPPAPSPTTWERGGMQHPLLHPSSFLLPLPYILPAIYCLLVLALLFYPPLWDATRLRPAGLLEPSPPRFILGPHGLWSDMMRERDVLAAQTRVGAALRDEVQAAGPRIFSDMPGVAAAAGVESRLQAFEARQLFDQGLATETSLLHELANGEIPLAVIDFLGNWLTPGVIEVMQRRYAYDYAIGTFQLYRPVAVGALQPIPEQRIATDGLALHGIHLAEPVGNTYEPGSLVAISLVWQRSAALGLTQPVSVTLQLQTPDGYPLLTSERPLLYGVYPPAQWPVAAPVQHMQPLQLPEALPDGRYQLAVGLQIADGPLVAPQAVIELESIWQGGMEFEATGHFVPARLLRAWAELGGPSRAGLPLTPVVPFAWGQLQCYEYACLELRGEHVTPRELGSLHYLAETIRSTTCLDASRADEQLCPGFAPAPADYRALGPAISGEMLRNGWIVQWSSGARLERAPGSDEINLGRLGDESLHLPPGMSYRWP